MEQKENLTHIDAEGNAVMVDVGGKQIMKDYMEAVLLMETDAAELRDVDVPSDLTYSCQK